MLKYVYRIGKSERVSKQVNKIFKNWNKTANKLFYYTNIQMNTVNGFGSGHFNIIKLKGLGDILAEGQKKKNIGQSWEVETHNSNEKNWNGSFKKEQKRKENRMKAVSLWKFEKTPLNICQVSLFSYMNMLYGQISGIHTRHLSANVPAIKCSLCESSIYTSTKEGNLIMP